MRKGAATYDGGSDLDLDDASEDEAREFRPRRSGHRRRHSPGLFWRTVRLIRLLVFVLPLSVLLLGSFVVDCRNRSGSAFLPDFIGRSACAREELTGHLSGLEQTMKTISQAFR